MYTGTLIDDLMATVERAEEKKSETREEQEVQVAYWQQATMIEMKVAGQNLLGVA
jgi:hypothetical protein